MASGTIFCSTIIPTIGRSTLTRAVNSVLTQVLTTNDGEINDFEIIVVNDSGQPLPELTWQTSPRVKIIHTNRHERSVARNTGAALARGAYLHFLDDDDWLLPGALESLRQLTQTNPAAGWCYGATQLVDRAAKPLIQLVHNLRGNGFVQVMAGEWIPLQASLIKTAAFFAVGGFEPLISGPEDIDLLRKIARQQTLVGTANMVACIGMGQENSTTDLTRHTTDSRWAREKILEEADTFDRLRASAVGGVWQGRMVRIYLTSMLWNLQRGRSLRAVSRASSGMAAAVGAGRHLLTTAFWGALCGRYESVTFARGVAASKQPIAV